MNWSDEYPHSIFQQVLLLDGKIIDWKVSNYKKQGRFYWNTRSYYDIKTKVDLAQQSIEIICNNSEEHNKAFENKE